MSTRQGSKPPACPGVPPVRPRRLTRTDRPDDRLASNKEPPDTRGPPRGYAPGGTPGPPETSHPDRSPRRVSPTIDSLQTRSRPTRGARRGDTVPPVRPRRLTRTNRPGAYPRRPNRFKRGAARHAGPAAGIPSRIDSPVGLNVVRPSLCVRAGVPPPHTISRTPERTSFLNELLRKGRTFEIPERRSTQNRSVFALFCRPTGGATPP